MHSRPSVCNKRLLVQLVLSGIRFRWGTVVWLEQESERSSSCAVFLTLPQPHLSLGKLFSLFMPSFFNLWNFYRILSGFYGDYCKMYPLLRDSFTEVTKEINTVAVVCPGFCFLWMVKWKWHNQTRILSQNPDFLGKIWCSCLSSTLNDLFYRGWDCVRVDWISPL